MTNGCRQTLCTARLWRTTIRSASITLGTWSERLTSSSETPSSGISSQSWKNGQKS